MKAKIIINNLDEPLNDELIAQCLERAQEITIIDIADYLDEGWASILVEGEESIIHDFARELELTLMTDIEVIEL